MWIDSHSCMCLRMLGHPFDLTKTRLQTASPGTYSGGLDVVKKALARDGPTGLYRGVVPPLLGVTPIFALSFWVPQLLSCLRDLTLWSCPGIRRFQETHPPLYAESHRLSALNGRARGGRFPICSSDYACHCTRGTCQSPSASKSPRTFD